MTTARKTELTGVFNRELMDIQPPTVTTKRDVERWAKFVKEYNSTTDLITPPTPLQIDYEGNSGCNLRCKYCTHCDSIEPNANTDPNTFTEVVSQASSLGITSMKLNYINEPLLNPRIYDMIEQAHDAGILNTYFATNGTLLNKFARAAILSTRLTKIMVSIDATTPMTYLRMRNSGRYEAVVANVKAFISERNAMRKTYPLVRVNFLKSDVNAHEQHDFHKMWAGIADMIGYQTLVGKPSGYHAPASSHRSFRCSFPFKMLVITHDGYILPCCTFYGRTMPLGHIKTMTIEEAWNSDRMKLIRATHAEGKYETIHACKSCINEGSCL